MEFVIRSLARFLFFRIPGTRLAVGILCAAAALGIFLWLAMSLGLYRMAQRQRLRSAVLAWIPGAQLYIAGALADEAEARFFYRWVLPVLAAAALMPGVLAASVASPALAGLGWLAFGLAAAFLVFFFKALYRIFAMYAKHPVPLLVLSIVFIFMGPIFVFALRNAVPKPVDARKRFR